MKRRSVSPFSLSFLDIMFCGFGAVVLLVLILNHDTVQARNEVFSDLRAEVVRLENEVIVGRENLVLARNSLQSSQQKLVTMQGEAERVLQSKISIEASITQLEKDTSANREHVNRLKSDLRELDSKAQDARAKKDASKDSGTKVHAFAGDGDRQYLTGLKLGGKRTLILVDASASMLDATLVNIIRLRNMGEAQKRSAPKWKRTLAVAEWLISNIPVSARFQVYTFNTGARPVLANTAGKWLPAGDAKQVAGVITGLRDTIPGDGTSLWHAFSVARKFTPRPDNILLITDSLPTQGRKKPSNTTVSSADRVKLFSAAIKVLPSGVPVNTILMPMEGDAWAAASFWRLAVDTRGSFLTPARDWP